MDTANLYQKIIFIIRKSFIDKAKIYGLAVTELQGINPSIEELVHHLNGLNAILEILAKDEYSDINMSINASQCVVIMERIAQAVQQENQTEVDVLMVELEKHANY